MDNRAYIIIHGFGGGLEEIEYLNQYLSVSDISARCVLLAGHGKTRKELGKSTYKDWLRSAQQALIKAKKERDSVVLIGFSMGGLICAYLEAKYKVDGLVLVNTPIYFWNVKLIAKSILNDIKRSRCDNITYYKKAVLGIPLRACFQFLRLLAKSKKLWSSVACPTLIVQCRDDESVRPKSAEFIKSKIKSKATLKYYQGGCHQVFFKENNCRENVCKDILNFLNSL